MRGQLQMATGELGFLTLYFPMVDRASGHFDANMSFEGTLRAPTASGVVKLSGAELDLYQLNLALRALEMEARIVSNNLEFSSQAKAVRARCRAPEDRMARQSSVRRDPHRRRESSRGRRSRRHASTRRPISTSASLAARSS
jgi:hypothetical protein